MPSFFCLFYYEMAFPSRQPVDVLFVVRDDYETNFHFLFVWTTEGKVT